MTRPLALLALVLLAGCANASTPGGSVASHVRSPSLPPVQVGPCRLPIGVGGDPQTLLSGFLAYPGGSFTRDPSSDPRLSPYRGPNISVTSPLDVPSYDWAFHRWLPVPRALVASDGATYTYSELVGPPPPPTPASGPRFGPFRSHIHIVDVASTVDRVVLDSDTGWAAVGYSGVLVYVVHAAPEETPDGGLYALDVVTGEIRQLASPVAAGSSASPISWRVIGSDAAWGTDQDGGLFRLDLKTGAASLWFRGPNGPLQVVALDLQGRPIVAGDPFGAWLAVAPQETVQIVDASRWVEDAMADAHGIWVLSPPSVDLWVQGKALEEVSSEIPQGGASTIFGGACLSAE